MEPTKPLSQYTDLELLEHFKKRLPERNWSFGDFVELERRGMYFLESDPELLESVAIENDRLLSKLREGMKPFLENIQKDSENLKSLADKFTPNFDAKLLQSHFNISEVFKPISDEVLKSLSGAVAVKELSSTMFAQNSAFDKFRKSILEVSALSSKMTSLGDAFALKSSNKPLSLIPSTPLDTPIRSLLDLTDLTEPISKEVEAEERKLVISALQNISSAVSQSGTTSIEANKLLDALLTAVRNGSTPKWVIIVATASSVAAALEGFFIFFIN